MFHPLDRPCLPPERQIDDEADEAQQEGGDAQVQEGEPLDIVDELIAGVHNLAGREDYPHANIGPEQKAVEPGGEYHGLKKAGR